jgi:hypothetical protein
MNGAPMMLSQAKIISNFTTQNERGKTRSTLALKQTQDIEH